MDIFGGAPRVLGYPRPLTARCGADVTLKCQIGGDPRPDVVWERKNLRILSEGRYELSEDGKAYLLTICGVTAQDAGQYTCKARNSVGETYAAATLKVEGEVGSQQEGLALAGVPNGTGPPGNLHNGESGDHLNGPVNGHPITNGDRLQGPDASRVTEDSGRASLPADDAARFLIKPISLRVDRGEDAAFSCKLWGTPVPEVVWEKDGKKLSDIFESTHYSVGTQDGNWFQLKIFRTRVPDKGVYTCRAANCHGRALAGALLLVEPVPERGESRKSSCNQLSPKPGRGGRHNPPRHIEENVATKVKKFAVSEGKHAKFRCFVTGKPKPEIIWKKDGVPLDAGRRHHIFEDREGYYTLKILYSKEQDSGLYVCAASNALGNTLSAVQLSVTGPLVRFRRPLTDVEVSERGVAVLECDVPDDKMSASWYLEDQRLAANSKYSMEQRGTRRRLTIRDAGADDDGVYLCEMPDGGKSIAELSVKGTIVRKLPRKLEVLEGENAAFCVEVEAEDMEVHWFKDGLKLRESHQTILKSFGRTHVLVFVHVAHQDTGVVVFVTGQSKTSCRLKVKAARHCPPVCPAGVQMDVEQPNGALLSWVPASTSSASTTRSIFVVERQEVGSREWIKCFTSETATRAEVTGDSVPCEGNYRFRVSCVNKYGRSGHVEFPEAVHLAPGPRIRKALQGCEVSEGEEARFSLELSACLAGTWFLNSTQLAPGGRVAVQQTQTRHSLVLRQTRRSDDAAEVTFIGNGVRDSAVLRVKPAEVKFSPRSERDGEKTVEPGDPVVLYCEVSHAFAEVSWFKDGAELQAHDGLTVQSEGNMRRIIIQSAEASDAGVYTCETAGDVVQFNVQMAGPVVEFSPIPEEDLHRSSMELDPVVLHCQVSDADAAVVWLKDGEELLPGEKVLLQEHGPLRTLVLRSVAADDAGAYSCRCGERSVEFRVSVREPPVMILDPCGDVVLARHTGDAVVLQCQLSRPHGAVRWFKDGAALQESEGACLESEGPYRRLTLPHATPAAAGEYVCQTAGDSVFFQLQVTEPPVRIVTPEEPEVALTLRASERLELSCELSRPDAPVRWYRDGLEVQEGRDLVLEAHGARRRLVIPAVAPGDGGEYVCDTQDDCVAFLVTVEELPVKLSSSGGVSAGDRLEGLSGEPLVLEVQVSRPGARVRWLLDGQEIQQSAEVAIAEDGPLRRLTVLSPAPGDSGKYTCDAGDDAFDFQVNVSDPPVRILRKAETKRDLRVTLADDIVLECELSRAAAAARWYKDGRRVEDDGRFCQEEEGAFRSLVILGAEMADGGEYVLDVGDDSATFLVTVEEPPVVIVGNSSEPDLQEMVAGDDLILACEVSRANAPVTWSCDQRPLVGHQRVHIQSWGTLRKIIISNVQAGDSGTYVCDAVDDRMVSLVRIQEPPVTFVGQQQDAVVTGYEAEGVTLTGVVSKETAAVRWLRDWTVVEGDRFRTAADGHERTLTIAPLRRCDAGEYTCDVHTDQIHFSLLVKGMRLKFAAPLQDAVGHADGMVTLRCEVVRPTADVQWLRNGQEVAPGRRFSVRADGTERSLTIHRLTAEDAGQYACETRDDRTVATLSVEMPRVVEFLTELRNTTVLEGEDATFKVVVSPEDVHLVWLMDNEAIAAGNDRFQATSNGLCRTLVIRRCQILDSSRITAEAEGVTCRASLKVQEAQVMFTRRMDAVMGEEFGEASLETEVSLDMGEVQWMRQGVVIQPGPRHALSQDGRRRRLTICSLSLADRGTYRCETLHDRTQVKLNVEPRKISVRKGLGDQETFEREAASFEVELSHADVEGVWQKDGIRVKPNSQWRVSANGLVHGLTLCNLTPEDSGTITFSAEGVRTAALLTVKETPVSFVKKLADQRVEEGSLVTLECEFSRQNVEVKWLKSNVDLKPGKNCRIYSMGRKRYCQVLEASLADAGPYHCDAGDISTTCDLEVYEHALELVHDLEDLYVQEDQNAVFMCELSLERVSGEWWKDGVKIRPSSTVKTRTEGTKHFLLICNVTAEDSGEIRFVAKDVECTAYLEVEELPPSIVKPLRDRTALERHRVILECTASTARCSAAWYRGGVALEPSDRLELLADGCSHRLVIRQVEAEDEGTYRVEIGEHSCEARLLVEAQELVMVQALEDVEVRAPDAACFRCEVSLAIDKPPIWTLNGETLHSGPMVRVESQGTTHKLTLKRTSEDMSGAVRFTTGKARSSATLRVHQE